MSIVIPEKPHLLYPSHIQLLGVEGALLFSLCYEALSTKRSDRLGARVQVLPATQWQQLTAYWEPQRVHELVALLVDKRALSITLHSNGSVTLADFSESVPPAEPNEPPREALDTLPVVDVPPPPPSRPLPSRNNMRERGPAPAFGGSLGWNRQKDELQQLFDRHEERNQQLHKMELNWRPSEMFFSMLPRHQIPAEFVEGCIDEFTLYYIDKDRRESNWDQKFLAWVKREWVQKQSRDAREQQKDNSGYSGNKHENPRRDTREKRKRVTAAIMDIKDTDW